MNEKQNRDWFETTSALGRLDILNAVLAKLSTKAKLVVVLREHLIDPTTQEDRLQTLAPKVKDLENALRFRLALLKPEQEDGWFKPLQAQHVGALRNVAIVAPVFAQFSYKRSSEVRAILSRNWNAGQWLEEPFEKCQENLWQILVQYRGMFQKIIALDFMGQQIRLDEGSLFLGEDIASPALALFFQKIFDEALTLRHRLDICYAQLWQASESFWQHVEHSKARQGASLDPGRGRGILRIEALHAMGLDKVPSLAELRQRYHELAKACHPDRPGGSEEKFKKLQRAYEILKSEKVFSL